MSISSQTPTLGTISVLPGNIIHPKHVKYKNLCHKLGLAEVFLGLSSILLCVATLTTIERNEIWNKNITHMAAGSWCGMVLILSGSLAIAWKNRNSKTLLSVNLMMSVVASVFMFLQLVISVLACFASTPNSTLVTLHAFLALVAFTALVACVLHASYTCATKCCFPILTAGTVIYRDNRCVQLGDQQRFIVQNQPLDVMYERREGCEPPKSLPLPPAYSEHV